MHKKLTVSWMPWYSHYMELSVQATEEGDMWIVEAAGELSVRTSFPLQGAIMGGIDLGYEQVVVDRNVGASPVF